MLTFSSYKPLQASSNTPLRWTWVQFLRCLHELYDLRQVTSPFWPCFLLSKKGILLNTYFRGDCEDQMIHSMRGAEHTAHPPLPTETGATETPSGQFHGDLLHLLPPSPAPPPSQIPALNQGPICLGKAETRLSCLGSNLLPASTLIPKPLKRKPAQCIPDGGQLEVQEEQEDFSTN